MNEYTLIQISGILVAATDPARGGHIITTKLTKKFTLAQFTQKHGPKALPLFA